MNPNAKINIKDLPQIQQISNGDYLVVESNDGTYILDYENLILGVENTAITAAVQQNSTDISTISGAVDSQIASLSASMYSTFQRVYVGKASVIIDTGVSKTALLSPRPPAILGEILPTEMIVTPGNADACMYPGFVTAIDNTEDNRGLLTISAPLMKRTFTVTGADYSKITPTSTGGIVGSNSLSAYTVDQFINGVQVYADPAIQISPYTVVESLTPSTADQLGVKPIYNVIVIKPY